MNPLSLQNIQKTSPYTIGQTASGDYEFHTRYGLFYNISFREEMQLGGCWAYQIIITNVEHNKAPHDPLIKDTIISIINEFFAANNDLMLYLCDTSDGRAAIRNRLFLSWFEEDFASRFTICTANATIEGEDIYAAIIVENNNPKKEAIITDFNESKSVLCK